MFVLEEEFRVLVVDVDVVVVVLIYKGSWMNSNRTFAHIFKLFLIFSHDDNDDVKLHNESN